MKKIVIVIAVIMVVLSLWTTYSYMKKGHYPGNQFSTIFSPPHDIVKFSLVDTKGKPFNNNTFQGQWTLLYFGFTQCGQTCATTMNNLNQMYRMVADLKQPMPQVFLISTDPERDTLKKLNDYVQSFNPNFLGATGDKDELDKLAANLNVAVMKDKKEKEDHSGAVLLIDPAGKLVALFPSPNDPLLMAKDYQLILRNSG